MELFNATKPQKIGRYFYRFKSFKNYILCFYNFKFYIFISANF